MSQTNQLNLQLEVLSLGCLESWIVWLVSWLRLGRGGRDRASGGSVGLEIGAMLLGAARELAAEEMSMELLAWMELNSGACNSSSRFCQGWWALLLVREVSMRQESKPKLPPPSGRARAIPVLAG